MSTVVTLATIPAVLALTNLIKSFGVSGKYLTLTSFLLGMTITVTEYLVTVSVHVSAQGIYLAVATGAILGLSASGLYDMTSPNVVEAKRAEISLKDGF